MDLLWLLGAEALSSSNTHSRMQTIRGEMHLSLVPPKTNFLSSLLSSQAEVMSSNGGASATLSPFSSAAAFTPTSTTHHPLRNCELLLKHGQLFDTTHSNHNYQSCCSMSDPITKCRTFITPPVVPAKVSESAAAAGTVASSSLATSLTAALCNNTSSGSSGSTKGTTYFNKKRHYLQSHHHDVLLHTNGFTAPNNHLVQNSTTSPPSAERCLPLKRRLLKTTTTGGSSNPPNGCSIQMGSVVNPFSPMMMMMATAAATGSPLTSCSPCTSSSVQSINNINNDTNSDPTVVMTTSSNASSSSYILNSSISNYYQNMSPPSAGAGLPHSSAAPTLPVPSSALPASSAAVVAVSLSSAINTTTPPPSFLHHTFKTPSSTALLHTPLPGCTDDWKVGQLFANLIVTFFPEHADASCTTATSCSGLSPHLIGLERASTRIHLLRRTWPILYVLHSCEHNLHMHVMNDAMLKEQLNTIANIVKQFHLSTDNYNHLRIVLPLLAVNRPLNPTKINEVLSTILPKNNFGQILSALQLLLCLNLDKMEKAIHTKIQHAVDDFLKSLYNQYSDHA